MLKKFPHLTVAFAFAAIAFAAGYEAGEAREPLRITPLFSTSETILVMYRSPSRRYVS